MTNELLWSDEIYKIFGLKPGEFDASYNDFLNVVHPEDRELVTSAVGESLNRLKPYDVEHRIVRPDGAERIVHEQGTIFLTKKENQSEWLERFMMLRNKS